ncbi:sporulation protein YunB [Alicyclobacillus cellulosilyticus]|uniref:Sporulation protein YunB n=1 Tax=Alicyclobacillus cellulosilyticus TaxID=1003997 RepID=A0A917NJV0_9BACL|nr:sporulation protein YunB [Alicyclobacillus cellulosilyticus]GGJ06276.1 sporulation protein YunB [Alicyclobacillus cellulosilyticus]
MADRFRPARTVRSRGRRLALWAAGGLLGAVLLLVFIDVRLEPVTASAARAAVVRAATEVLNRAVADEVADDGEYARIIEIDKNQYADFQVLHFNLAAVARLQTKATQRAEAALRELGSETIWLPLGQVLGGSLFSGVGPRLPVRFDVLGSVHSAVDSEVKSAGINETVHLLFLDLSAQMNVMAPFVREPVEVRIRQPIAYVILSGKVPDAYARAEGGFLQPIPSSPPAANPGSAAR